MDVAREEKKQFIIKQHKLLLESDSFEQDNA